jgi:tetratricopeptide (TPR) repeat protein
MSEQQKQHDGIDEVNEALSRTEQVIEKNQKPILLGVLAVIIIVTGFIALRHFYFVPKEKQAQADLYLGEFYFQADSFATALNGDGGQFKGFLAIIDDAGSTKAGNLAKAYAGISYMRMGQYDNAIKYLKDFSADDLLVSPAIIGAIGDCYVELGQTKEGISYFEKAASRGKNDLISPIYLKKAGIAYESLGDYAAAVKAYQQIKDNYSGSIEALDIEKYIERASLKK